MKPDLVISCPASSRSGYGDHSRDIIRSLIAIDKYNVMVLDQPWGGCPRNSLTRGVDDDIISRCILQMKSKPKVWIQVTVPNEFQPVGEYNIGITAGMETDLVSAQWVQGCNNMDLVIVPSKHAKFAFENTSYTKTDKQTGQSSGELKVTTPIEVVFEGLALEIYNKITPDNYKQMSDNIITTLDGIKQDFCYLTVGHWLSGEFGHDRKDIGGVVQTFLHTFKDRAKQNQPALILKTSSATYSLSDRYEMLQRIESIKRAFGENAQLPEVYLLHGDLTPDQMNLLYNHNKVKAMVSFTHGEGFGRPLLEFGITGKPVIAPDWSGHVDFLSEYGVGLPGELKPVHSSAVWKDVIIPESKWFYVNHGYASGVLKDVVDNYKKHNTVTRKQTQYIKDNFSLEAMDIEFSNIINKRVPDFPVHVPIKLPKLPTLKKVGK
ncbi:hypothetical protein N9Z73_00010 [bacterium]|nr:hypothetical protein [bacterium]